MRNWIFVIIITVLAVWGGGCSDREAVTRLDLADRVMEEHPDSALRILQEVDTKTLRTDKDRALYALLRTQALVKNDSVIASDSLIRTAADYYTRHPSAPYLMKSAFYLGEVQRNLGNLTSAVKSATQSYDLAREADDPYWIAKSAEQLMFIYTDSFNEVEAQKYAYITADNYKQSGHHLNYIYSLCDICLGEQNAGQYQRAFERIDSVIKILPVDAQEGLTYYCHIIRFPVCVKLEKWGEAFASLKILKNQSMNYSLSPRLIGYEAELYRKTGNMKRAEVLLDSAFLLAKNVRDKSGIFDEYYNLYKAECRYKEALDYRDSVLYLQSQEVTKLLMSDISLAQKDYYKVKTQTTSKQLTKYRAQKIIIFISASLLLVILFITSYLIWKRKNKRIKRNIEDIQLLMEQISGMGSENRNLKMTLTSQSEHMEIFRRDLIDLFQDQPKILNKLCDQYFDKSNTDAERLRIVDSIGKHIEKFKSDQNMHHIEESVDKYMNGIIGRLRNQDGLKISERDMRLISLCCAGFSAKAICLFLNIKIKNFYNIKYRLADRISAVGKDEYLEVLRSLKNS